MSEEHETMYSTEAMTLTSSQGLQMVVWCNEHLGEQEKAWDMLYSSGRVVWIFWRKEDLMMFKMVWG